MFINHSIPRQSHSPIGLLTLAIMLYASPGLAGPLYFERAGEIWTSELDGSAPELVWSGAVSEITVDVPREQLYWFERGGSNGLYKSRLDGSMVERIGDRRWDHALAIDSARQELYYAVSGTGLFRSNLDLSGEELVLPDQGRIFRVAVNQRDQKIYWNKLEQDLHRMDLDGTSVETIATGLIRSMALDPLREKIYWAAKDEHAPLDMDIMRANLDGSGVEHILQVVDQEIESMAVDSTGGKIYWVDDRHTDPFVFRANLDGSGVEVLHRNGGPLGGTGSGSNSIALAVAVPEPGTHLLLTVLSTVTLLLRRSNRRRSEL